MCNCTKKTITIPRYIVWSHWRFVVLESRNQPLWYHRRLRWTLQLRCTGICVFEGEPPIMRSTVDNPQNISFKQASSSSHDLGVVGLSSASLWITSLILVFRELLLHVKQPDKDFNSASKPVSPLFSGQCFYLSCNCASNR